MIIINACFGSDRSGCQGIVAGHHYRAYSHFAHRSKSFLDPPFYDIFEVDDSHDFVVVADKQGGSPFAGNRLYCSIKLWRIMSPKLSMCFFMASAAPFRMMRMTVYLLIEKSMPLMRVLAEKGMNVDVGCFQIRRCSSNWVLASTTMERPSGVSSDREANWAMGANSFSPTPLRVKSAVAIRFPMVIVPVLSRINKSMSPAASTERPLLAITFRCIKRSMPAMPTALNRALIVVGIRQTSSETKMGMVMICDRSCLAASAAVIGKSFNEAVASKKNNSQAERTMCRAISLGVRCRFAPSIRLIIRSKKLFPGSEVTLIFNVSLNTLVPAVTALRSPPLSRMTGADSPVMADSSTVATPSTTSPSAGMTSPASQMMISPFFKF